jgi:hypothetical protein
MNTALNVNDLREVRKTGFHALKEALGPVGMVRFMQQYDGGSGDYTKEKYQEQDYSVEELDSILSNY